MYVDVGASPEIDASLVPLQTYGSMFIDSTPQGADVYVDGNYEGTSPVTVAGMSDGPHQVELHLAGYEVLTQTVSVTAGQGSTMNFAMVPYSSSSQYGSIDISSDIPGAVIYLDGTYKGSTMSGSTFNIISVSPGSHTLLLHVPGYTDFTRTVQVSAGQIATVNAVFSQQAAGVLAQGPQPGVQGTEAGGSIIASSSPAGGEVYVDNQFRGVAPVTIYNVASGTHIVNMKLGGYADWSSSVRCPCRADGAGCGILHARDCRGPVDHPGIASPVDCARCTCCCLRRPYGHPQQEMILLFFLNVGRVLIETGGYPPYPPPIFFRAGRPPLP